MVSLKPIGTHNIQRLTELASASKENVVPRLGEFLCPCSSDDSERLVNWFLSDEAQNKRYGFMIHCDKINDCVGLGFVNSINTTHKFCNLGYWIASEYTGKGYATETAKQLISYAIHELKMVRMEFLIEPSNIGSAIVAERAGCKKEARLSRRIFGRDADMYAYCLSK